MPASPILETPAPAPTRKGERTAARILDAAEALFAERGYAGTTLRDVAARVGVRNPSLYNHFSNKESLYRAVLERRMRPLLAVLSEFALENRAVDAERLLDRIMGLLAEHPSLPRLFLHETLGGAERITPMLREWFTPALERARELVDATSEGRWGREHVPFLVLALYHVVVGFFTVGPLYEAIGGDDLTSARAVATQKEFLKKLFATVLPESGLAPPGSPQE